jgi:competence ComEA-like helix-hairpin-helix protein
MTRWTYRTVLAGVLLAIVLMPGLLCAKKKPPAHPVNLNTASSEELQLVPGIGPSTADKILQMRKSYGAFKSVDDLLAIKGIGPKRMEKMRKYLTVGKAPQTKKSSTDAQAAKALAKPPPGKTNAAKTTAKSKTDGDSAEKDDEEQ